ncbi:MAG: hypothetical protein F2612_01845 [Actinobacteria bacterium]|uniref:Unannotated protein n=1 Tax=freshwater metagenome TaxID=449393 RepID=A0A6J6J6B2_9ZZZZ|nr:hypothetical protein [Actinomycetota bacterium]
MSKKLTKNRRLPRCGGVAFLPHKRECLERRHLLTSTTWPAVLRVACARGATISHTVTLSNAQATEVVLKGVTVVLVRDWLTGEVVILTAYVSGADSRDAVGHLVQQVAQSVTETVGLHDRFVGWA